MFFFKLLVITPLVLMVPCLMYIFNDPIHTVSDFKVERVSNLKSYVKTSYIGRRSSQIIIEANGKAYTLSSMEELIPKGMTLEQIVDLLNKSSKAILWIEEDDGLSFVRGIQAEYLTIPPSSGINYHNSQKKWALFVAGLCLFASIACYLYFKRYFGLDWKMDFKVLK